MPTGDENSNGILSPYAGHILTDTDREETEQPGDSADELLQRRHGA